MSKVLRIFFQPDGKEVFCQAGVGLVEAASLSGILIPTPCGGQGRCGGCLVQVREGEVEFAGSERLSKESQKQGWVLACQSKVIGDAVIFIPQEGEREEIILSSMKSSKLAFPIQSLFPILPSLREIYLELPQPSLQDNISDLDRVEMALRNRGVKLDWDVEMLRLLPLRLREGDFKLSLLLSQISKEGYQKLIDIYPGKYQRPLLGLAVDIGTTNIALALVDLRSGKIIEKASARNKQVLRGDDVISRIIYAEKKRDGLSELQQLVISTLNELIIGVSGRQNIDPNEIKEMVVAGNTIMTHLFLGMPVSYLRREPYVPVAISFPVVKASDLGINIHPRAPVYCLPSVSAYVGGDIIGGVLSSSIFRSEKLTLFLDIGTNGEMVLGNREWLTTCACSAGPAFEGYGVLWGMRAIEGAIEGVRINHLNFKPTLKVIGGKPPKGICGSGMITALSEMFLTGVVDRAGRINVELVRSRDPERARYGEHGAEYVLAFANNTSVGKDIVITEADINNLIRAKAAVYAGVMIMAKEVGVELSQVEEVLIGGAFGRHIDIEGGINIGLLPDLPWLRFKFLGNTSLAGAYNYLVSREARRLAEELPSRMTYFELIASSKFMEEFSASLFLPHTNLDLFPSVKLPGGS